MSSRVAAHRGEQRRRTVRRCIRSFIVALAVLPASLSAQTLVGEARAIDGDSLSVGGMSVRLFGIDAPEGKQTCIRDGAEWACGEHAAQQLGSLVEGQRVVCRGKGADDYGRTVAVCEAAGVELNRTMVAQGWAIAFRRYSPVYVADEVRAKEAKLGIWSSTFVMPDEWRTARAPSPADLPVQRSAPARFASANGNCLIKGNRNRKGQWIYHLPGMPYYEPTRAEEWFCTEAAAQAAGYRRAIVK